MNDNAPEIRQDYVTICKPKMGYTDISAFDADEPIHGAPFYFSLANPSPEVNKIWTLSKVNGIHSNTHLDALEQRRRGVLGYSHETRTIDSY